FVAEPVVIRQDLLRLRSVRPEFVLVRTASPVNAEDRAEGAELEPANEEFSISRIVWIAADESTNIGSPVWQPGDGIVEPCRNLSLERLKVGEYVSGPCGYCGTLRSRECRASKNEDPLLLAGTPLPLVNALFGQQRIQIHIPVAATKRQFVPKLDVFFQPFRLGLHRVQPPRIDADAEQRFVH